MKQSNLYTFSYHYKEKSFRTHFHYIINTTVPEYTYYDLSNK